MLKSTYAKERKNFNFDGITIALGYKVPSNSGSSNFSDILMIKSRCKSGGSVILGVNNHTAVGYLTFVRHIVIYIAFPSVNLDQWSEHYV